MPTAINFAEQRKQAEDAGLISEKGDYLKLKEGDNRFRLLSACLPHAGTFKGKRNFKWLCYVLDRKDGKIKPFFMPHTVYKQIEALQMNPDYEFSEVPMPYDLTIHAKGAGTVDVVYTLMPARKNTPVTVEEQQQLADAKPLAELQQAILDKQKASAAAEGDDHSGPVDASEIPF